MKLSLVIHNLNRADALDKCLRSVVVQTHRPLEVVLLDAGSLDGSKEVMARWTSDMLQAGMEVVAREVPFVGVSASRNLGASFASGEVLCYLDNDAEFTSPHDLAHVPDYFKDERLAVIAWRILREGSREMDSWPYRRPRSAWSSRTFETFTFAGGGFGIRATALRDVGGFWEALEYAREEEELGLALIQAGWRLRYAPTPTVRHYPKPHKHRAMEKRRAVELRNGVIIFWRRLPMPLAVMLIAGRFGAMSMRMALRGEGSLMALWKALPEAVRYWRANGLRRRPVSMKAFRRYAALQGMPGQGAG